MGGTIQQHVGKKVGLVNLTGIGTWRSDPDGNLIFQNIWKIVIRAIVGNRFFREITRLISPQGTIFNKEDVYLMSLLSSISLITTSFSCVIEMFK